MAPSSICSSDALANARDPLLQENDKDEHDISTNFARSTSELSVQEGATVAIDWARRVKWGTSLRRCLPVLKWLPEHCRDISVGILFQDVIAGLTVAAVLLPQGIAYGMLSGLPAVYGLYTALLPPLTYMLLGTCMHLCVGPFALIAIISESAVSKVVPDMKANPSTAAEVSAALAFMVGGCLVLFSVFRLGFLAAFLSDPVMSGFCTACSLIIPMSQLKHALQLEVPKGTFVETGIHIFRHIGEANQTTFTIAALSLLGILALQFINKNPPKCLRNALRGLPLPAELIVSAVATGSVALFELDACPGSCVHVLGKVPSTLPVPSLPSVSMDLCSQLWSDVLVIALLIYIISMTITKTYGRRFGYEIDNNQELMALGMANVLGSFCSSFPASSSLSRTAIAESAGARSPLHSLWTTLTMVLVLRYATELLQPLPMAVLSAVVMMAFKPLLMNGLTECKKCFNVSVSDFAVWQVAFWLTLVFGVRKGIALAVCADVLHLIYRTSRPAYSVLGRVRGSDNLYQTAAHFEDVVHLKDVLIFRFESPLHFACREVFASSVWHELKLASKVSGKPVKAVVLDASAISHVDMSACRTLDKLRRELYTADPKVRLVVSNCNAKVFSKMEDMDIFTSFEASGDFDVVAFCELHDAVLYVEQRVEESGLQIVRAMSRKPSQSLVRLAPCSGRDALAGGDEA
eukprot:TRINITY_DN33680_c0_g1_i1.p1 TRINITY_DN33680_c0_g1~~TRINITY_DN33680_c0_g1_i1.p1  ORF type:complete len:700 (-),score=104.59 TRINITY_DN33680_c0_g1_i1:100-2175(-)